MEATTPSRTALATALMRSLHTRADPHPILHDPWGERLVPAQVREAIAERARAARNPSGNAAQEPAAAELADEWLHSNPGYPNVIVRSRFAEDALHAAIARGVRQYVLVGAGFDSYALRLLPEAQGLRVFEVDHPATQSLKLRRLEELGVPRPPAARFLAADLGAESLGDVLARSDFDRAAPAFFSWLGVTMYLSRAANLAALRAMAQCGAAGSELVFTYTDQQVFEAAPDDPRFARHRDMQKSVAALGEPYLSGFHPATLAAELQGVGFELLEDLADGELVRRYDPQGRNGLRAGMHGRVAHARVAR